MDIFAQLLKKKEFIYEIQGKYYCIGYDLIDNCTEDEVKMYKELMDELENMRETLKLEKWERNCITKEAREKLMKKFNKVLSSCNRNPNANAIEVSEIKDYIRTLPEEEQKKLEKQLEQYYELIDYSYYAFHKYDLKFKEDTTK